MATGATTAGATMASEHPLHDLAMAVRMDLTAAQGKLTEMMRQIGELEPPGPPRASYMNGPVLADTCPGCGCGGRLHTADCSFIAEVVEEVA